MPISFHDASKAFDRVSHNTLFSILEKRGPPLLFLKDVLLNVTHVKLLHLGFQMALDKEGFCPVCS